MTKKDGRVIKYLYDGLNNLRIIKELSSGRVLREYRAYNQFKKPEIIVEYGANHTMITTRDYTILGQIESESTTVEGIGVPRSIKYVYDKYGRVTSKSYPDLANGNIPGGLLRLEYVHGGGIDKLYWDEDLFYDIDYDSNHQVPTHFDLEPLRPGILPA